MTRIVIDLDILEDEQAWLIDINGAGEVKLSTASAQRAVLGALDGAMKTLALEITEGAAS